MYPHHGTEPALLVVLFWIFGHRRHIICAIDYWFRSAKLDLASCQWLPHTLSIFEEVPPWLDTIQVLQCMRECKSTCGFVAVHRRTTIKPALGARLSKQWSKSFVILMHVRHGALPCLSQGCQATTYVAANSSLPKVPFVAVFSPQTQDALVW